MTHNWKLERVQECSQLNENCGRKSKYHTDLHELLAK